VLVIADDNDGRRAVRKMFDSLGFDVVHASNGFVGLELIQRLPRSFQLVLTDLDLPGIPGVVIMETLRLFRPELPVLCMGEAAVGAVATGPRGCLAKPLQMEELRTQAHAALASTAPWEPGADSASEQAVRRARARYGEAKSLVDAALELARGSREE
jgi:DNA-binding NtrC family response regulator